MTENWVHLVIEVGVVDIGDGGGEWTIGVGGVVIIGGGDLDFRLIVRSTMLNMMKALGSKKTTWAHLK